MSLTNRKILWENGTTDGFQLIRMPYRAPFGGVAAPEKDDDAVPLDYLIEYVAAHSGGGGASITNGSSEPVGGADGDYYIQTTIANQIWYNNAGVWSIILSFSPITVDYLTLSQLTVDHAVIEGQVYKYVDATYLPASIDHILLTGSGTQTYNNIGQAYVTAIGKYVQCDYDLASNTIICVLEQEFLIIDDGVTFSLTPLKDDFVGITYTLNLSGGGLTPYIITASSSIWDAAKTKVVGYYGIDVNNDPIYSFGEYIGGTTISVEVFNAYSVATSGHEKQDSITFKVITTL